MVEGEDETVAVGSPSVGDHGGGLVEEHFEAVGAVADQAGAARHAAVGEVDGQFAEGVLELADQLLVGHPDHGLVELPLLGVGWW